MNEDVRQAVFDALNCLMTIDRERTRPRDAQRRLAEVAAVHPRVGMELVWEEESYDGSLHYDALLRPEHDATISLGYCRDPGLPWPLRGVRRWSDADLAQVNGRLLKMQDAVAHLDVLWQEAPIMNRMIDTCLIREELDAHPIELSDADLQFGVDGLRRAHRLFTPDATQRWLQERGMTHGQLEQLAADNLTGLRLREKIARGRVDSYFEAHRSEFDCAHIARFECDLEETALTLRHRVNEEKQDFLEATRDLFPPSPRFARYFFTTLRRREVLPELAAAVFEAEPGALVGPTSIDGGYALTHVLALSPARLDDWARAAIQQLLFDEWLAERRQRAHVTWYWGTSDRESAT
jgi:putative peptide maturation system protein